MLPAARYSMMAALLGMARAARGSGTTVCIAGDTVY
jgi:hypothetical protein